MGGKAGQKPGSIAAAAAAEEEGSSVPPAAAPSTEQQNQEEKEEDLQPFSLSSLPEGLLATHVWPHLGPWARAQLRATCRQLRAVADGQLGPELRVVLGSEELIGPDHSASTLFRARRLNTVCSLLQRAPGVTSLTLVIGVDAYYEEHWRQLRHWFADSHQRGFTRSLRKLGQAAGSQLLKLCVKVDKGESDGVHLTPGALKAVGSHFPSLTHLRLGPCYLKMEGVGAREWEEALTRLPQSLVQLHLETGFAHLAVGQGDTAAQEAFHTSLQVQAAKLPALRGLCLGWNSGKQSMKQHVVEALTAGAWAGHPLQHLALHGRMEPSELDALAAAAPRAALGSSLVSLDLACYGPHEPPEAVLQLLKGLPLLQHLGLSNSRAGRWSSDTPVLWQAICSLQHLRSLTAHVDMVLQGVPEEGEWEGMQAQGQDAAAESSHSKLPASLAQLRLYGDFWQQGETAWVLRQVLPQCRVLTENKVPLQQADAAAALAHPGGVGLWFRMQGSIQHVPVEFEAPGMVNLDSSEVLQAMAPDHPVRSLMLPVRGMGGEGAAALLQACAASHLSQLHTLALGYNSEEDDALTHLGTVIGVLLGLWKEGQLGALDTVILEVPYYRALCVWKGLLPPLIEAGIRVALLPVKPPQHVGTGGFEDVVVAVQQLRRAMPDPDLLQLAWRDEPHGCHGHMAA